MKVAVFGCLHGMLDEMYEEVRQNEQRNGVQIDFIIVCGDCQTVRHADDLKCMSVPPKYRSLGDFHQYYSGSKKIPKLTIFVGGNHEASNYLMTLPYGGWVCENFYYMGYSGVIRYKGLRIAGVSGIFNHQNCRRGRFERLPLNDSSVRSVYHTRELDIFRLQLLSNNAQDRNPIDVFISHDWPSKIYDHGNKEQLLRFKPFFSKDIQDNRLGSPLTEPLIRQLKPRRWFAAHLHCRFYAKVSHDKPEGHCTEFLSLDKIENKRKFRGGPDSRKNHVDVLDLVAINEGGTSDNSDDNLYYDEEWLTVLRKTKCLEQTSQGDVNCPKFGSSSGEGYIFSQADVEKTVEMMNATGGLVIKRNFTMVEPVIYNRPDGTQPSEDSERERNYTNPQHEELCSRLRLHNEESSGLQLDSGELQTTNDDLGPVELDENGCLPFVIDKKRKLM